MAHILFGRERVFRPVFVPKFTCVLFMFVELVYSDSLAPLIALSEGLFID